MKSLRMNSFRAVKVPAVFAVFAILAILAVLSACNGVYTPYNYGGNNNGGMSGSVYTLSGTVTLTNLAATGYAYVTATAAGYPYSAAVLEPAAASGVQSFTYSVTGLPAATYTVTVAVMTPSATPSSTLCTWTLNSGSAVLDSPSVTGAYTWTMTVGSVSVTSNATLDVAMQ
jgi:hypothetical protein